MSARTAKFKVIPRVVQTGADSYQDPVFDVALIASNGEILFRNNQGHTTRRDAGRAITAIRRAAATATVEQVQEEEIDRSAADAP